MAHTWRVVSTFHGPVDTVELSHEGLVERAGFEPANYRIGRSGPLANEVPPHEDPAG